MRLILLLALLLASFTYAHDARFRFLLEPGTENCFYEDVRKIGNFIEYSYKVEKGGASGLQFVVRDPAKNIVTEDRTKLKIIKKKFLSKSWGEYQFCFRHVLPYFPEKKIEFMYNSVEDPLMEPLTHEQKNPIHPGTIEAAAEYEGVEDQLTKVELAVSRSYSKLDDLWDRLNEDIDVTHKVAVNFSRGNLGIVALTILVAVTQVYLIEVYIIGERDVDKSA
ncbi:emp24/gp25L/p24 family/GOLD-domain-containing protein [Yarrowia lipolytica]|jgi:hypothetical protein|uniref:YALI0F23265p n=2 Tax=Yarrowia lipolytica TaxID=4952 RepID=Q6C0N1_YARLI|nr:YALI0F23265p [Yarrowia lipolytica CLIB122]AOW07600.1 hypothetical protein YALI1_F30496g [Yarrowia lipolytica]KAB8280480.1 emp24/gp25L/p24 family/GOLD-domain-containing protein [Yarrowia lipolytica]KAE8169591.1 emp24/gp25L/p24 family/GOLD-domain-containing protein [Yarrowia lipolytica]KAJ8055335.1 emp24/gp25L/p24 family/GOLD-domain-containing protein [Yarrowia lipolytica]QNP99737.1 Hypothetical protein YALI2_E01053g [Yarrowia lipolytica]|eukprot:XP_505781.1 YALI0F23265p [Yarrowia lipolytica CLIB122]